MLHIKKIKPLFTSIVTTGDKYEEDMYNEGLIEARKGDLKTYQKVVAVGSSVRDIKVGDMVMINVMNYAVKRYSKDSLQNDMDNNPIIRFQFNWVQVDDEDGKPQDCLLLNDRDVLFAFEGEEVQGAKNPIIVPEKTKIIMS
jgi:hypothetical protein